MDVKDFCSGMEMELTAWKAKLYDTWRKFDKLGTAERERIQPKIEEYRKHDRSHQITE